jgi:hypothetical protein
MPESGMLKSSATAARERMPLRWGEVVALPVLENHVESDLIDAAFLLRIALVSEVWGMLLLWLTSHTPASVMCSGKISSGSSSRIVWFIVQR